LGTKFTNKRRISGCPEMRYFAQVQVIREN
jgi:hypothetical protein